MPAWSPNDDEIAFVSQDRERSGPADVRDSVPGLVGGERRRGASALVFDAKRHGMPAGAAWNPDGTRLAHSLAGGHLGVNGAADQRPRRGCVPVPAKLDHAHRVHLHRRRPHQAAVARRDDRRSSRSPPRCRCSAARSRSRTARSSPPGRSASPASSSPRSRPTAATIAFTAIGDLWLLPVGGTPVQITNDAAFERRSGLVARRHAARVRQRSRRAHGSVGPRSAHRHGHAGDARARAPCPARRGRATARRSRTSSIAHELRTVRIKPGDCRGGARESAQRRRARAADVGARLPVGRGRRAVSLLGSVPRRAEPAAALFVRVRLVVPVGAVSAAFRRQPRERRPGLVAERHAHGVRHRGQAVGGGGRRRGRRDRSAAT